ncbi:MAG: Uncharacterised protein [Opitutia bacterium UBA7350]|nr:MAG: Uncharacterised protein [Opitutae bacterium UBA7350]
MDASAEQELEAVTRFFVGMGAVASQAEVMAQQLLKRASQISAERNITKVAAVDLLLRNITEARAGRTPKHFHK